jgi:hypothetical protein
MLFWASAFLARSTYRFGRSVARSASRTSPSCARESQSHPVQSLIFLAFIGAVILSIVFSSDDTSQDPQPIGWISTDAGTTAVYPGQPIPANSTYWPNANTGRPAVTQPSTRPPIDWTAVACSIGLIALICAVSHGITNRGNRLRVKQEATADAVASQAVQRDMRNDQPKKPDDPPHPWRPYPGGPFDLG